MLKELYKPNPALSELDDEAFQTLMKCKTSLWHLIQNVKYEQAKAAPSTFFFPTWVSEAFEQTEKKFQRTLQRLKDKGIYVSNLNDLFWKISETTNLPLGYALSFLPGFKTSTGLLESNGDGQELADEAWFSAIELVVARFSPDMIDDSVKNYAAIVEQHVEDLYVYVSMSHFILMYVSTWSNKQRSITLDAEEDAPDEYRVDVRAMENLELENQRLKKKVEKLNGDLSDINTLYQKSTKEIAQVRSQLRAENDDAALLGTCKARIIELERRERRLEACIDELTGENELLKEILAEPESSPALEVKDEDKDELEGIVLPENDVIFLGGHISLVNKLRKLYPEWTFINDIEYKSYVPSKSCKLLIMWTSYMSHSLQARVFSFIDINSTPIIYANATNVDILVREIKSGYKKILEEESGCD